MCIEGVVKDIQKQLLTCSPDELTAIEDCLLCGRRNLREYKVSTGWKHPTKPAFNSKEERCESLANWIKSIH
jgi:hypothetical protein